jgi:hypothetical protein
MKLLRAIGYFCYDFVIGDDWKIAAYVVVTLAIAAGLAAGEIVGGAAVAVIGAILASSFFVLATVHDARRIHRRGST